MNNYESKIDNNGKDRNSASTFIWCPCSGNCFLSCNNDCNFTCQNTCAGNSANH